ncbi:IS1096 element passenger TnpR family protein [Mobilicoccus pelagius]|uniref:Plasmid pRiA4b Orf3-like domain-containing protein n=1 Tax=Mobilicoccus pelagius NBRC 104925 TaxID=1089455 RepID=H5USR3_9MICO|nr:hypothetical protein [Mobilicoccus pelagius]GAB48771.1 hypothetical protein MOPEL_080_00500 [Mobilicoccus pelagius NBRC 104925]
MDDGRGRVIRFPSWRREAAGAPGVPAGVEEADRPGSSGAPVEGSPTPRDREDGPLLPDGGGWRPRPTVVGTRDHVESPPADDARDVWHEGATVTGEVLVRMRVDALGAHTPIWRRLECHGSLGLDRFHRVLAAAFGWPHESGRPHRFAEVIRQGGGQRLGGTFGNAWADGGHLPAESAVRLDEVLADPRDRLRYWYGPTTRRSFRLTVLAEDVLPLAATIGPVPPARLVTGRRASPDVAFETIGFYELKRSGAYEFPGIADLLGDAPEIGDPTAVDLPLLDARVRAAAES